MDATKVNIIFQPTITDDQLWEFFNRNDICEVGYGKETATKPLHFPNVSVGAFYQDMLVGYARAMFDGVSATIMAFCLELQGTDLVYENGSLIESDTYGIGKEMGRLLIDRRRKMGNTFVDVIAVQDCEERFYESLGLKETVGHKVYYIDERCYTRGAT